jgi:Putative beta-barrel porin-2, OmpL-like. bbp2
MYKFRALFATQVVLWIIYATACSSPCFAQSSSSSAPMQQQANASAERNAILTELEGMKRRIVELETELKEMNAQTQHSAVKGEQPTAESVSTPSQSLPRMGDRLESNTRQASGNNEKVSIRIPGPATEVAGQGKSTSLAAQEPSVPPILGKKHNEAASEPFEFADFTWLNGNSREKNTPLDTKLFTPEFRADVSYIFDFNHPKDDTLVGSSESGRTQEVQVQQLGIGGDFHFDNVRGRLMTQFGMYSTMTPRNDASPARGQWDLADAYRYLSEAYGGYHFNVLHGVNVDGGIFMSYIGLFSYYNYDNWAYQPSYVSSNTPWFFNGIRVQIYPTDKLKIEPWFINGWQSYGRFNKFPGLGGQIAWRPTGWLAFVFNNYGMGTDTLGVPGRSRIHTDDSVEVKYFDNSRETLDKAAFSLTGDAGCEYGGGVSCHGDTKGGPKQSFLGYMAYNRLWFAKDRYGFTVGGGKINNPGRYLVLVPPINGATAATGTPYFTANPGDPFKAWDTSSTFDFMPSQYITFRWEFDHRAATVPYFAGSGGVTPPGGNNGKPGSYICLDGSIAATGGCGSVGTWFPDLRKTENRLNMAILVKF